MTRWHDITKRNPTDRDLALSHRRGEGILIVYTRDGSVGEWPCRMLPTEVVVNAGSRTATRRTVYLPQWQVPWGWSGDTTITHWRRMPRPPGEWRSKLKWRLGRLWSWRPAR